jgi:GNAT superfamily N-acetyltransferase
MDACREELTLHPEDVGPRRTVVAERDGAVVGLYTLDGEPPEADVGLFFVDPEAIGTGVGRALWEHMSRAARDLGFERLSIESDPYAEGFYLRMGAERVGESPSRSISERNLPLLRYVLS